MHIAGCECPICNKVSTIDLANYNPNYSEFRYIVNLPYMEGRCPYCNTSVSFEASYKLDYCEN